MTRDLQCIGKKSDGTRCKNVSPQDPPYSDHPDWPYLCGTCAALPPRGTKKDSRGIVEERIFK
jgi:hypothetical protein